MHDNDENWSLVIKQRSSLFNLNLAEVWNYKDLILLLVRRDFVSFYKQTIFGPVWFFIQPFFTTFIYVFIFGTLASLSTDGLPQTLFYLTNIVAWNYFSECLNKTSTVFRDNANIFGKVYFPRLVMPLSIVISNLTRFGVQLILLALAMLYYAVFKDYTFHITWYILLFPLMVLLMAAFGLGAGMIISAMTTKYRDLSFLVSFGIQLLMYVTPVIYPLSAAHEKVKWVLSINPMTPILEGIRLGLLGKGDITIASLLYAVTVVVVVLFIGIITFNKVEKSFVDTV
ncbi:ABC transporter permease [Chitinophagaceae bacterium IBVUCB1]|nr:ABC transporter permease [Chitinophagaceae bacterium IBVUCB1]